MLNLILGNCKIYLNEILIGNICGFVIGAKGICQKFNDYTDINDFNNSIFLSSNAGVGFVVGCVGGVIYENINFGIFLYIVQIISGYIIFKLCAKKRETCIVFADNTKGQGLIEGIVKAVKVSTSTILTVCGFNVFFSALCDLIINSFGINKSVYQSVIVKVFFDIK